MKHLIEATMIIGNFNGEDGAYSHNATNANGLCL